MGTLEAGKKRVEQYILEVARGMKREDSVGTILWWPAGSSRNGGAAPGVETLRIYDKGSSWRAMEVARSDLDRCVDAPEVLNGYQSQITQIIEEM